MANESESRAVAAPQPRPIQRVENVQPMLDSDRFEHFQRASKALMHSSILNPSIRGSSPEQCFSNLMLVFDLSDRWKLPAISIAQGISIVHDKVVYEGKLIAAMLDASLGVTLYPWWQGERGDVNYRIFISDKPWDDLSDEELEALKPGAQIRGRRIVDGSVGEWRTFQKDGRTSNPAWTGAATQNQLLYRGSREWARRFEPAQMLGVYGDDEIEQIQVRMVQASERAAPLGMTGFTRPAEAAQEAQPKADEIEDAVVEEVDKPKAADKPQEQPQEAQVADPKADDAPVGEKAPRGKRAAKKTEGPTEDAIEQARENAKRLRSYGLEIDEPGADVHRDISAAILEGMAEGEALLSAAVELAYQQGLEGRVMTELKPDDDKVEDADLLLKRWEILRDAWNRGQEQAKADADGEPDPVDDDLGDGADGDDEGATDFIEDDEGQEADVDPITGWILGLEELQDWPSIKSSLNGFIRTPSWTSAKPEDQARIRAAAWNRQAALINAGKDRLDFINDLTAFRCWIETTTDVDAIQGNWMTLVRQRLYEDLTHEQKQGLERATMNRIRLIQGAAAV